jgi:hypothetical protein
VSSTRVQSRGAEAPLLHGINFLMDEGQQRIRDAYGTTKYDRLRALKRKYDPDNLRMNQNIAPA